MTSPARISPALAAWSLIALAAGLLLGTVGQITGARIFWDLSGTTAPLGTLWIHALQMVVVPLVIAQLLSALVAGGRASSAAALGGRALAWFIGLLLGTGALTLLASRRILDLYTPSTELVGSLRVESIPDAALEAARSSPMSLSEFLTSLIPQNAFQAVANGEILQILVFTVLVGLAAGCLPDEQRALLSRLFRASADTMMVLVSWVLWGTPIGVFSLILGLSLETGLETLNLLGAYIVALSGLLLVATALLYPLTSWIGRLPLRSFARSVAPAQLVAVSTQSSLASLPALVSGAQGRLGLSEEATGFVLPLCVSTFKLNQAISPLFKFLLLAHVFGIPLGAGDLGTFLLVTILLSFTVAGVPRGGGGFRTLPLYLAVGIPIEGVVILEAVKTIPDIFMTLLNVTADMSVAAMLTRKERTARGARTVAGVGVRAGLLGEESTGS